MAKRQSGYTTMCKDIALAPASDGYMHRVAVGPARIETPDNPQRVVKLKGPLLFKGNAIYTGFIADG